MSRLKGILGKKRRQMRDLEGLKECLDDKRKDERKDEDAWQRPTSAKTNSQRTGHSVAGRNGLACSDGLSEHASERASFFINILVHNVRAPKGFLFLCSYNHTNLTLNTESRLFDPGAQHDDPCTLGVVVFPTTAHFLKLYRGTQILHFMLSSFIQRAATQPPGHAAFHFVKKQ